MKGVTAVLLVLAVVHSAFERGHAAVTCSELQTALSPCVPFGLGLEPEPSETCCNSARSVLSTVTSTEDKRTLCNCVKGVASQFPDLIDKVTTGISKCGVKPPFPITSDINCDTIQ